MTQRIFETLFIGYTILLTKLSKFHECTVFQKKKNPIHTRKKNYVQRLQMTLIFAVARLFNSLSKGYL